MQLTTALSVNCRNGGPHSTILRLQSHVDPVAAELLQLCDGEQLLDGLRSIEDRHLGGQPHARTGPHVCGRNEDQLDAAAIVSHNPPADGRGL